MTGHGLSDLRVEVLLSVTFMGYLVFPGVSASLWKGIRDSRILCRAKRLCWGKRQRGERSKKYWEINMRNFK